jgi:2-succinyl-5-enolpyruvyl-6-hydroxy-3-cyclohexene-1-carboxylate synthase
VHLNARARKPLEPTPAVTDEEKKLEARTRAIASSPLPIAPPPRLVPSVDAVRAAAAMARDAKRGVIVAGPAALSQRDARDAVWSLAKETGFVVAADATSQLRFAPRPREVVFLDGFELLLRSQTFKNAAAFDCAIQIGAPPTSGPWEQLVPSIPRIVVAEHGWNDPHATARVMMFGDVGPSCAALAEAVRAAPPARATQLHAFASAANEAAWRAVDAEIGDPLVEAGAVRTLVARAPEGASFVIGNSLAVRLVDIYVRAGDRDHAILSQRGASGIDGLVAGAAGAATATGRPLALLLGDVSLLHDATSLALAARVRTPLVVLVLHNGGGRIFEMLPIAETRDLDPAILEHALTTHETDFAHAAALAGVRHVRVASPGEVETALAEAWSHPGCTLVEARVAGSGAIALSRRVAKAVEAAVAAVPRGNIA